MVNTASPILNNEQFPGGIQLDTTFYGLFGEELPEGFYLMNPGAHLAPGVRGADYNGQVFANGFTETVEGLARTKRLAALSTTDGSEISGAISRADLGRLALGNRLSQADVLGLFHGPCYHLDEYTVLENQFYGIEGGYTAKILWVYNEYSQPFMDALHPEAREVLSNAGAIVSWDPELDPLEVASNAGFTDDSLASFPHLPTFLTGHNEARLEDLELRLRDLIIPFGVLGGVTKWLKEIDVEAIDVDAEHFNLMACYAEWTLNKLAPLIEEELLNN
jgi:hypothetical protein